MPPAHTRNPSAASGWTSSLQPRSVTCRCGCVCLSVLCDVSHLFCVGAGLERGVASSPRSSTGKSGGEAAERQSSAAGNKSNKASGGLRLRSEGINNSCFFSGQQCIRESCEEGGGDCDRGLCGANQWKPRGPGFPVGGPVHEPGHSEGSVWWGEGLQVSTDHRRWCLSRQLGLRLIHRWSTCRAAQRLELKGIEAYSDLEGLQGLHTLPTAIVDYRGVRLSAQGLAPGLEDNEQDPGNPSVSRYNWFSLLQLLKSDISDHEDAECVFVPFGVHQRVLLRTKCRPSGVSPSQKATRAAGSLCQSTFPPETYCRRARWSPGPTVHIGGRSGVIGG